jgi:methyl acetate hydrolase
MTRKSCSRREILKGAAAVSATASFGNIFTKRAAAVTPAAQAAAKAEIDKLLSEAVKNKLVIPGVVAMVATDNGILYQGAFGKRDVNTGSDMTLDSVFWLASMTKAITATAAMQLVDQGRLQKDQRMTAWFPRVMDLAEGTFLAGFDQRQPRLIPVMLPMTLTDLLTHTAGFAYGIWNEDMAQYIRYANLPPLISCKNEALKTPIVSPPGLDPRLGSAWNYGTGLDFVGKAVEQVSGQSLEVYFRENMFKQLGMKDTSFILRPDQMDRLVKVHRRGPNGTVVPTDFLMPQNPEFFMGGGGLYGTAGDYLAFLQMLMHGGTFNSAQILRPETVTWMSQNRIGDLSVPPTWYSTDHSSSLAVTLGGMLGSSDLKWGVIGVINTEPVPGGRSTGSSGWAGLANTFFWLDPIKRVAAVILTQSLPFWDLGVIGVCKQFETSVYKALATT